MFYKKIFAYWQQLLTRRRLKKELAPDQFKNLAHEIKGIADLCSRIWTYDNGLQNRIKRIQQEMEQLEKLVQKRGFDRLSLHKKEELKRSLLISKQELLKSLQSAPCVTERIQ